jgi:protein subunit release factor A
MDKLPQWQRHEFRIARNSETDLFISGLGWIKVNGTAGAVVAIHVPRGVKVLTRPSLI